MLGRSVSRTFSPGTQGQGQGLAAATSQVCSGCHFGTLLIAAQPQRDACCLDIALFVHMCKEQAPISFLAVRQDADDFTRRIWAEPNQLTLFATLHSWSSCISGRRAGMLQGLSNSCLLRGCTTAGTTCGNDTRCCLHPACQDQFHRVWI
jgi:hypothetical protein